MSDRLALLGGPPAVRATPPRWPVAGGRELWWMSQVVRSGEWAWMGRHERAFCQEFAAYLDAPSCVGVANGSVALQCALLAVGVRPGDEVIVPALTWVATAQAVLDVGADVVFVDVDPVTWCLDPGAVEQAITPRTRAVIPVHLYGCMADMDAILGLAEAHHLKVIEDVAHQPGSRWRGVAAGTLGDAGTFSFQRSKVLTSGEGGAVVSSSREVAEVAFSLKHVGWNPDLITPGNRYGRNFRLTEMQAVLLRGGLRRLESELRRREEAATLFAEGLERIGGPVSCAPRDPRVSRQCFYALGLRYDRVAFDDIPREQFLRALEAEGVRLFPPYVPAYRNPLAVLEHETGPLGGRADSPRYADLRLPVAERISSDEGLTLPHPWLLGRKKVLGEVLSAFAKVVEHRAALARSQL